MDLSLGADQLLPETIDDECEPKISRSPRDKHGGAEHRCLTRMANQRSRQTIFEQVQALHKDGKSVSDIVRHTGFNRRTIVKWIRADALPQRNAAAPKTTSPRYFQDYVSRGWSEGCVRGRRLFQEVKARGYTGSFSNLERLLAKWRNPKRKAPRPELPDPRAPSVDPSTGRSISPIVAAALCVKPRGTLTSAQEANVDMLKREWADFASMRALAMRFRGILCSKNADKLSSWLKDAQHSGLYAIQRLAHTLRRDFDAVRNAITDKWSNGQAEGQINRLKAFKRATSRARTSARAYVARLGKFATEIEDEPIQWLFRREVRYSQAKMAPDTGIAARHSRQIVDNVEDANRPQSPIVAPYSSRAGATLDA